MPALLLKLVLTPLLVGLASLAGRRWGAEVGGWLVGIPLTSGPIAFFLAIGPGTHFAADASIGILAGTASQAAFALAYAWTSLRLGWIACAGVASLAFVVTTVLLNAAHPAVLPTFGLAVGSLAVSLVLMPKRGARAAEAAGLPWWDIPLRMTVATAFVIALTEAAPVLGSRLSGLLAPFPVYAMVLAVFAHRLQGTGAATAVLRGLLLGLFSFTCFFLSIAELVVTQGIAVAFGVAIVVALIVQALSLGASRRYRLA